MNRWLMILLSILSLGLLGGCDRAVEDLENCDECKRAAIMARERALLASCKDCVPAPPPAEAAAIQPKTAAAPERKTAAVSRIEIVQPYRPEPEVRASDRRSYARSGERDSD